MEYWKIKVYSIICERAKAEVLKKMTPKTARNFEKKRKTETKTDSKTDTKSSSYESGEALIVILKRFVFPEKFSMF
jgi:hypothetical protein